MKKLLLAATCLGFVTSANMASAANPATGSIAVTAQMTVTCTVTSPPLGFGSVESGAVSNTATATIVVGCDGTPVTPTITLDAGGNAGHVVHTTRAMTDGSGDYLDYDIYTTTGRTTAISTTVGTGVTVTAGAGSMVVYGEITSGQYEPAGAYSDSINISMTY